jgi:hypothetical protein
MARIIYFRNHKSSIYDHDYSAVNTLEDFESTRSQISVDTVTHPEIRTFIDSVSQGKNWGQDLQHLTNQFPLSKTISLAVLFHQPNRMQQ